MADEQFDPTVFDLSFEAFFVGNFNAVARSVFYVVNDSDLANEIAQDAFVKLYEKWPSVRHHDNLLAWVRKVAVRKAMRRRYRHRNETLVHEVAESGVMPVSVNVDLHRAVQDLPAGQRAAIVLFYYEDMSLADVADVMGCRVNTVKKHLEKGRAKLANLLRDLEEEYARAG